MASNFPDQGPVMWKVFPCHDVVMILYYSCDTLHLANRAPDYLLIQQSPLTDSGSSPEIASSQEGTSVTKVNSVQVTRKVQEIFSSALSRSLFYKS